ncbi:MAG: hypothetical protein SF339_27155 [Blastocatellia bacterium]|nr:hypothetical protein [Blastocatellia bacterium]
MHSTGNRQPTTDNRFAADYRLLLFALALCAGILVCTLKLWQADLRVPLVYYGEAKYNALLIKTVMDHGWHLRNPSMGMPDGLDLRDVPMSDNNLHIAAIKLLGLFSTRYGRVLNLFFLLTFPLVTASALYVLRHFGVSRLSAVFAALLYTFLPYHFVRGEHHLFLAAYFTVPLAVMMVLWVAAGAVAPRSRKMAASVGICLVLGATGTYYAFFTCFFLLVAGGLAAAQHRRLRLLAMPCVLVAILFGGLVINLLPSILYLRERGDTPVVQRQTYEAEIYALRIGQLLLPVSGHRLFPFAAVKAAFNQRVFINENDDATLGAIGSIGFLSLFGWLLFRKPEHERIDEDGTGGALSRLSILNLAALLLGTFGGVGALVALLVTTKIRAYNRLSVFIAFFSLMGLALLLDRFARRHITTPARRMGFAATLAVALALGLLDQTTPAFVPEYAKIIREFNSDAAFMRQIQSTMPSKSMIFQLPFVPFPEYPKVGNMYDYDHARGILHTQGLQWSYGAMKGREGEIWQRQTSAQPTPEMLETIALSGFQGLYLNRNGYRDNPSSVENELTAALGKPRFVSEDGKLLFFDLRGFEAQLRGKYAADWEARRENAMHPLITLWTEGFSDQEGPPDNSFRWSRAEGELRVTNGAPRARRVRIELAVQTENDANLWISGPLWNESFRTNAQPTRIERELTIPPGTHAIRFRSDGRRVIAPGDFRTLIFKVSRFRMTPVE